MRNIIRTALILSTLAAPAVAFADAPTKPAPTTDTAKPAADSAKTTDKTPAKDGKTVKTPAKDATKTAPKSNY